ncbi:DUF2325 domain-containing protein [Brevibacillus laterosporus]
MSILIIGGDRLGNILQILEEVGYKKIHHITGRKSSETSLKIPSDVKMILVLTDFVNHNLAKKSNPKPKISKYLFVFVNVLARLYLKCFKCKPLVLN